MEILMTPINYERQIYSWINGQIISCQFNHITWSSLKEYQEML